MNPWAILYDIGTGRIQSCVSAPQEELPRCCRPGQAWMLVADRIDNGAFYIRDALILRRPVLTLSTTTIRADGQDAAIIEGMPSPCTVTIDGVDHEIEGGRLELTADQPAAWRVIVWDPFPAQFFEAVITAEQEAP